MTLEQRNFVISSMNEDVSEQSGHDNKTTADTTKDDFLHEPEDEFSPIPKDLDPKKIKAQIDDKLGMSIVNEEKGLLKGAKIKQGYRVSKGRSSQKKLQQKLLKKAQRYKEKGIDKSYQFDKYEGPGKAHGFKV